MKGTEFVGEGGKSIADLPAASLLGARSAGKDPTVVMMCPLVYCKTRFGEESGSVEGWKSGRVSVRPFCGRGRGEVEECRVGRGGVLRIKLDQVK